MLLLLLKANLKCVYLIGSDIEKVSSHCLIPATSKAVVAREFCVLICVVEYFLVGRGRQDGGMRN